jgi:hypothetical protein
VVFLENELYDLHNSEESKSKNARVLNLDLEDIWEEDHNSEQSEEELI